MVFFVELTATYLDLTNVSRSWDSPWNLVWEKCGKTRTHIGAQRGNYH